MTCSIHNKDVQETINLIKKYGDKILIFHKTENDELQIFTPKEDGSYKLTYTKKWDSFYSRTRTGKSYKTLQECIESI